MRAPGLSIFYTIITVVVMASCGGGGGSSSSSSPVAPFTLTPTTITATTTTGSSTPIRLLATRHVTIPGQVSVSISDPSGVLIPGTLGDYDFLTGDNDQSYYVTLHTSPTKPAGHYTGSFSVQISTSSGPIAGSPVLVPFDIQVHALTPLTPWQGVADWGTFQGNPAHTGYVPVTFDPTKAVQRWIWEAPRNDLTPPTTGNGKIYVGSANRLFALNEYDGKEAWNHDFSGLNYPSINPPATSGGQVFMVAGQQGSTLFAFDTVDGSLGFTVGLPSQWDHYLAPTIGANGIYTNAGGYGGLYAIDFSGNQLFGNSLDQVFMWTPAVDASGVYSYTGRYGSGGILRVVDPKTGLNIKSINDLSYDSFLDLGGSVVLGAPGSVIVANYSDQNNKLINFNTNNETINWQISGGYNHTPAYFGNVIYAPNSKPFRVEAISESTGNVLWSWAPTSMWDGYFVSEIVLTKNAFFVSTKFSVYAVDLNTHQTLWTYPLDVSSGAGAQLALSANGILYIKTIDRIIAINLK